MDFTWTKPKQLTDRPELKDSKEIENIEVVKKRKYLGMSISCDRKDILKDAKVKC